MQAATTLHQRLGSDNFNRLLNQVEVFLVVPAYLPQPLFLLPNFISVLAHIKVGFENSVIDFSNIVFKNPIPIPSYLNSNQFLVGDEGHSIVVFLPNIELGLQ